MSGFYFESFGSETLASRVFVLLSRSVVGKLFFFKWCETVNWQFLLLKPSSLHIAGWKIIRQQKHLYRLWNFLNGWIIQKTFQVIGKIKILKNYFQCLAICCTYFHFYSFNDNDLVTEFVSTGTFCGYVIILTAVLAGERSDQIKLKI